MNNFAKNLQLGALAEIQQGKYLAPGQMSAVQSFEFPVPVVGGNKILGFTNKATTPRRMPLVTCRGSNCGLVQYPQEPVWVSNNAMAFDTGRQEQNDFLYYLLSSIDFRDVITGSAQPQITKQPLAAKEVLVPEQSEWAAIAAMLGALDEKIESNRRLIDLIPRLISAHLAKATARESELIPISRLATFVNGGAYTKGATGTGRMVLRIAELNKGPGSSTVYNDIEVPEEKLARSGDILMSWSGSLGVYRWARDEAIVNQHIFKVIPRDFPDWLVFDRLKEVMPVFKGHAADKATTMGHIQRGHLDSTNVAIPAATDRIELDQALDPLWQRLLFAEREVLELEQLRDALLPELLSGRIRVGEVAA